MLSAFRVLFYRGQYREYSTERQYDLEMKCQTMSLRFIVPLNTFSEDSLWYFFDDFIPKRY